MNERLYYVHWNVSGELDSVMVARFNWWRFEIHWPDYDKVGRIASYPVKVYYRNQPKGVFQISSLDKCTYWIMETCKDLALTIQSKP